MPNRAEYFRQLEEQHAPEVQQMREFVAHVVPPAIAQLSDKNLRSNTILMFLNGILDAPHAIHFRGKTYADFTTEFRQSMGDSLYRFGLRQFESWLKENWAGKRQEWTASRIADRNMNHFVETWYGGTEKKPQPNWEALQQTHELITSGQQGEQDPLYVRLFNGAQISALELFLEDTAPPDEVLNQYLLQ